MIVEENAEIKSWGNNSCTQRDVLTGVFRMELGILQVIQPDRLGCWRGFQLCAI